MAERMYRDPAQPCPADNGPGEIENRKSVDERSKDARESGPLTGRNRELRG
jgi:hypothetical protein